MKKGLKYLLMALAVLFVLLNTLVAVHSYGLTHVSIEAQPLDQGNLKFTFLDKVKLTLTGVDIPKPKSDKYPQCKYEDIRIPAANDGDLAAWLIHTDSTKHGIAIFFHGFIDQKSSMIDRSEEIRKMGYDVLLVDFRASGQSEGDQTTIGYYEAQNVAAGYHYAHSILLEDNIILFGFSMGAAAITKAQHDKPMDVSAIILEAPYATFKQTVANRVKRIGVPAEPATTLFTFWMGSINGFDAFSLNPIEYVKHIKKPTLLMCGAKDQYIPVDETNSIFEAIGSDRKSLKIFDNSTHESYLIKHKEEWKETINSFLANIED